jgi:hypothetical protein
MIVLTSGELEDRRDVFVFQVRVVSENFLSRGAGRQKVEDILDTNAEAADARTPAAHVGIYGDSVNGAHVSVPLPPAAEPRLYPDVTGSTIRILDPGGCHDVDFTSDRPKFIVTGEDCAVSVPLSGAGRRLSATIREPEDRSFRLCTSVRE